MSNIDSTSSIKVMTYNIRMDTASDGPNRWANRKHRVLCLIKKYSPDILTVQEPIPSQMTDLRTDLSNYISSGVGRDDGQDKGEYSAIFYRRDRFQMIDEGTFWLSNESSKPGSKDWDAALTRICSWTKLNDRLFNTTLTCFNTHLDHKGIIARRESTRIILSQVKDITNLQGPIIVTGDFNSNPKSDPYHLLTTNTVFKDSRVLCEKPPIGPDGTWSSFDVNHGIGDRIDFIFVTPAYFKVLQHQHITDSEKMTYPSDHLPVLAELVLRRN